MTPHSLVKRSVVFAFAFLAVAQLRAANLTYSGVQGGGANWSAAIWQTNGTGTAVSPVAGNSYEVLSVGTVAGLIRSPTGAGAPGSDQTFAGDTLQLDGTNGVAGASIRFKGPADLNTLTFVQTAYYAVGTGNNPANGLILNGGFLANGDDDIAGLNGPIHVIAPSGIYGGQDPTTINTVQQAGGYRGFVFGGTLSGTADLIFGNAVLGDQVAGGRSYTNANFVFKGDGSEYSGNITVTMGWLQAASADGFGAGNITIAGTSNVYVVGGTGIAAGPAKFNATVTFSSPGKLTILDTNSMLLLDNDLTFGQAAIDGVTLATNTAYTAAQINALTLQTNVVDPSGTHTLTVGGTATPPVVSAPAPEVLFANQTAKFSVAASGFEQEGVTYAWQRNGSPLGVNPPHITSVTNSTLVLSNVTAADVASYTVIVTGVNSHLSTTSAAASLSLITPNAYEASVMGANPVAVYSFSDENDPALGNQSCFDSLGGFNGIYGTAVQNGNPNYNIAGPTPADGFPFFPSTNTAAKFVNNNGASVVTLPPLNLNTNAVTISAWVYPTELESGSRGIVFCRSGGTVAGLRYNPTLVNNDYQLGYVWADTNTAAFQSGIYVPQNQWSLVALSVTASNATLYCINTNGIQSAVNAFSNVVQSFSGNTLIGCDNSDNGAGSRVFGGSIDQVTILKSSLSTVQLLTQYGSVSGVSNFPPRITSNPLPTAIYSGGTATFTVGASLGVPPQFYQWYKDSTPLANGPSASGSVISGATNLNVATATLTLNNIAAGDVGNYTVVVTNSVGSATSSPVALSLVSTSGDPYGTAVVAAHAAYFYELNETTDPSQGGALAFDFESGNNGVYGASVMNGFSSIPGPLPSDGFPNFPVNNTAALLPEFAANGVITTPGWNFNSNTLTITAWVNPNEGSPIYSPYGIVMARNGTGVAQGGLNFSGPIDINGFHALGYSWGDSAATTNWNSGIYVPQNQWSFVAVSVTSSNATIYLINTNGLMSAVNTFAHANLVFNAPVTIGGDPRDGGNGTLTFPGTIDNVAIFKSSLSQSQLVALYYAASGVSNFPPTISIAPTNITVVQGAVGQFTVAAGGSPTLQYQWKAGVQGSGAYTNLNDGGQFSGTKTSTLTVNNVDFFNGGDYIVAITNPYGATNSAFAPATLAVNTAVPPQNLTLSFGGAPLIQGQGTNWDTANQWSDGNPASTSAASAPNNTYEVQANALLRTPTATAIFPGKLLTIDGDGVFNAAFTNGGTSTVGELRIKATPMTFPKLVMNGGQLDASVGALQTTVINGEIDILANTPVYNDSGNDQGYTINAYLTGSGTIEFRDGGYNPANGINLNVAGNTNSYSGAWNVLQGTLLGTGANALGTNNLFINTNAALETTYDLNSPHATLTLNGQMFLHQNDTFFSVTIGGNALSAGTHSFSSLQQAYPSNFPASWTLQNGSSVNAGSGSIAVLSGPAAQPVILFQHVGNSLVFTWTDAGLGILQTATNLTGPWTPVPGATSPYTNIVSPTVPDLFFRLKSQ